jgi:hypothetical protein
MIIGSFTLKLTANQNLVGEYANNDPNFTHPLTECANRVPPFATASYLGKYISTWHEPNQKAAMQAELDITYKAGSISIFDLSWKLLAPHSGNFKGEGMICGDTLIGYYQQI